MTVAECPHTVSQGREGEPSGKSWCVACGELSLDVETRQCGDCHHFFQSVGYAGCHKHLMAVTRTMHACFRPKDGTCWEPQGTDHPSHWSHRGADYDGTDCENCGRQRVLIYANKRRICEKCNWDQVSHDYAADHERIG